ncbi:RNA polymerase sigma-70 factor (ECF subfamily) [Pedobacter africanus]|uniref:RNA polymerase sigma-70 factor (ECF subfamily) n=1 Tax=Pedobacter africanus TaxID=151894 RepID=A0ACC6KZ51_9SPHI|nr:RNA polymerase sigma-70 factor [Pedobacter africanus]MDR6784417.1 RNA polymerase sigma-70 factor (ECF subfamily) [Pedobacter africanus]
MSDYSRLPDSHLLNLLHAGEKNAFGEIYKRYGSLLYIYAFKLTEDNEDANDIVQEVFLSLLTRDSVTINKTVSAYLYSAVRYKVFDLFSHRKVKNGYVESLQDFIDQGEYLTDNYIREKELARLVEKEIELLPSKMRQVFESSRKANLSQKQIAEKYNISEKTVKKQINNSIKILKMKLGKLIVSLFF